MSQDVDLVRLGQMLQAQREARGLRRSELARRSGLSQGYIGNVETARPRIGGKPSRPTRGVLATWTRALDLSDVDADRILAIAGYSPEERDVAESIAEYGASAPAVDWEALTDELVAAVRRLLHLARDREEGRQLAVYLQMTVNLLEERLGSQER